MPKNANKIEKFLFEDYHENSKLFPKAGIESLLRISRFFGATNIQERIDDSFKAYADPRPIALDFRHLDETELGELVRQRESVTPVPLEALSTVLLAGYAEVRRRTVRIGDRDFERGARTIPSGGGLYPLEIYVWNGVVSDGSDMKPGEIYHFHPRTAQLESIGARLESLSEWFADAAYLEHPPSTIVMITGLHKRSSIKYGERAYRFLLLEAGHAMQNMIISATKQRLASVPIGGFFDDNVARSLCIDRREEYPLYSLFLSPS